jgi:hypothetical protein
MRGLEMGGGRVIGGTGDEGDEGTDGVGWGGDGKGGMVLSCFCHSK